MKGLKTLPIPHGWVIIVNQTKQEIKEKAKKKFHIQNNSTE